MLSTRNSLVFPHLVRHDKDARFGHEEKTWRPVYRVDWESFQDKIRKNHEKWVSRSWPDSGMGFVPGLPQERMKRLAGRYYAIDSDYMQELRRCSLEAVKEYGGMRPFDTNIRESCLRPGQAFVRTAFMLLADCAYDLEANYWDHSPEKRVLMNEMLVVFWTEQTGDGLVRSHAELDELTDRLGYEWVNVESKEKIFALLADFEVQLKKRMAEREKGPDGGDLSEGADKPSPNP